MSTFNKLFVEKLYEKGVAIDAAALKGDPGVVTNSASTKGDRGADGKLNVITIETVASDTKIVVPSTEESTYDVYHILKPTVSNFDIHVVTHLDVKVCTLYAPYMQEVVLYKRDTNWVF